MGPTIDMEETGKLIRRVMSWKQFSVKDVQEYLGLTCVQSVYRWLEGYTLPSLEHLYGLSELFQMPMDYLIAGDREYQMPVFQLPFFSRMQAYHKAFRRL